MKQLLILLLFISTSLYSQEFREKSKQQTEQQLIKSSTKTNFLYKGKIVYKTKNDKYFIVLISKNGNSYKKYIEKV